MRINCGVSRQKGKGSGMAIGQHWGDKEGDSWAHRPNWLSIAHMCLVRKKGGLKSIGDRRERDQCCGKKE